MAAAFRLLDLQVVVLLRLQYRHPFLQLDVVNVLPFLKYNPESLSFSLWHVIVLQYILLLIIQLPSGFRVGHLQLDLGGELLGVDVKLQAQLQLVDLAAKRI